MSHPPPLSDKEAPRSGKNPPWIAGWVDWSAEEMRYAFEVASFIPVKECGVLLNCGEPVVWAVRLHDCLLYTACEEHSQLVAGVVMAALCQSGLFVCQECGVTFNSQADAVRFWKI